MLIPTTPRHFEMHKLLVSFIRARAREWRADPLLNVGEFLKCMPSELQTNAALLVAECLKTEDEQKAFASYMEGCAVAWGMAKSRDYDGYDLINDTSGLIL